MEMIQNAFIVKGTQYDIFVFGEIYGIDLDIRVPRRDVHYDSTNFEGAIILGIKDNIATGAHYLPCPGGLRLTYRGNLTVMTNKGDIIANVSCYYDFTILTVMYKDKYYQYHPNFGNIQSNLLDKLLVEQTKMFGIDFSFSKRIYCPRGLS